MYTESSCSMVNITTAVPGKMFRMRTIKVFSKRKPKRMMIILKCLAQKVLLESLELQAQAT